MNDVASERIDTIVIGGVWGAKNRITPLSW
jgi:hypothetical protein